MSAWLHYDLYLGDTGHVSVFALMAQIGARMAARKISRAGFYAFFIGMTRGILLSPFNWMAYLLATMTTIQSLNTFLGASTLRYLRKILKFLNRRDISMLLTLEMNFIANVIVFSQVIHDFDP